MDPLQPLYGFYRSRVVENDDTSNEGKVLVWIPVLMANIESDKGIWARSANDPVCGRNTKDVDDQNFMGSCMIPPKGSWVLVFFEGGNPNNPFYTFGFSVEGVKVLPECRVGDNPQSKWVPFKSHDGRTIILSDDPSDERLELTGKKRTLSDPPSGDISSVYTIDNNQTVILIDDRDGKEKVLIRTRKGDYLNIDTEERSLYAEFESGIHLKSGSGIYIEAASELNLKGGSNVNIEAGADANLKSGADTNIQSGADANIKSLGKANIEGVVSTSLSSFGETNIDGTTVNEAMGKSTSPNTATPANSSSPKGGRED